MFILEVCTPKHPRGQAKNTMYHVIVDNKRTTLAAFCEANNLSYPTIRQRLVADTRLHDPDWFTRLIKNAISKRASKIERCSECGRPKISDLAYSKALVSRDGKPVAKLFKSIDDVPLKGWPVVAEIFPAIDKGPLRVVIQDRAGKRWYHLSGLCRALYLDHSAVLRDLTSASLPQNELIDIQHFIWKKEAEDT